MEIQRWRRDQARRAGRLRRVRRTIYGFISLYLIFSLMGGLSGLIFGRLGPVADAVGFAVGLGLGTSFGAGAVVLAAEHYLEFGRQA